MQNQQTPLLDVMHNVDAPSTASNEVESIYDIPSVLPILTLRTDQITRYSRQLLLNDGFGIEGQKRLLSLSVLVIGAGGVGSTVLLYLTATGFGHITVVDYENVECRICINRSTTRTLMPLGLRACSTVEWSCPPRRTRSTTVRNVFTGWFDKFAAGALGIATRDCRSYVGRSVARVLPM